MAERSSRDFTVVCDNCQVKEITVEGDWKTSWEISLQKRLHGLANLICGCVCVCFPRWGTAHCSWIRTCFWENGASLDWRGSTCHCWAPCPFQPVQSSLRATGKSHRSKQHVRLEPFKEMSFVCLFLKDVMFLPWDFQENIVWFLQRTCFSPQHSNTVLPLSPSPCSNVELPFHWRIMEPNLRLLLPGESPDPSRNQLHLAADNAFQVRPPAGVLAPCRDEEFLLTFCPKEVLFRGDEIF